MIINKYNELKTNHTSKEMCYEIYETFVDNFNFEYNINDQLDYLEEYYTKMKAQEISEQS